MLSDLLLYTLEGQSAAKFGRITSDPHFSSLKHVSAKPLNGFYATIQSFSSSLTSWLVPPFLSHKSFKSTPAHLFRRHLQRDPWSLQWTQKPEQKQQDDFWCETKFFLKCKSEIKQVQLYFLFSLAHLIWNTLRSGL